MSYLDRILQPDEKVLVRGELHWVIYLWSFVLLATAVVLAIWTRFTLIQQDQALVAYSIAGALLAFGIITFLSRMLVKWTTEFAVTDHRVVVKRGLISRHTVEMNVDKVESVDVDQTILGRILGYGSVTVHGTGARWDPIRMIADLLRFRNAITSR